VPRDIDIFNNTIVAKTSGMTVRDVNSDFTQRVVGNAIFAGTPLSAQAGVIQQSNVTESYESAKDYLLNPNGDPNTGELNLYALEDKLQGPIIDMTAFQSFSNWDADFNGDSRTGVFRGAYAGEVQNDGWQLIIDIIPSQTTPTPGT